MQIAFQTGHEIIFKTWKTLKHSQRKQKTFNYQDGGTVHLDWVCCPESTPEEDELPILVIVPGFNNESHDMYMQVFANTMAKQRFHCVQIGHRGM